MIGSNHASYLALFVTLICLHYVEALTIYSTDGGLSTCSRNCRFTPICIGRLVNAEFNIHGRLKQLEIANGAIALARLNPNINLTPLIESELGEQIQILEWADWSIYSANSSNRYSDDQ